MSFRLVTKLCEDGKLTAIIYNNRGKAVGELSSPVATGEVALSLARKFEEEHPELFENNDLVDTAEQSEKKNPDLFGDGKLETIPEK